MSFQSPHGTLLQHANAFYPYLTTWVSLVIAWHSLYDVSALRLKDPYSTLPKIFQNGKKFTGSSWSKIHTACKGIAYYSLTASLQKKLCIINEWILECLFLSTNEALPKPICPSTRLQLYWDLLKCRQRFCFCQVRVSRKGAPCHALLPSCLWNCIYPKWRNSTICHISLYRHIDKLCGWWSSKIIPAVHANDSNIASVHAWYHLGHNHDYLSILQKESLVRIQDKLVTLDAVVDADAKVKIQGSSFCSQSQSLCMAFQAEFKYIHRTWIQYLVKSYTIYHMLEKNAVISRQGLTCALIFLKCLHWNPF